MSSVLHYGTTPNAHYPTPRFMHVSYLTCLRSPMLLGEGTSTPFIHECNATLMHVLLSAQNHRSYLSAASLRSHILVVVVIFHLLHRFFDVM